MFPRVMVPILKWPILPLWPKLVSYIIKIILDIYVRTYTKFRNLVTIIKTIRDIYVRT